MAAAPSTPQPPARTSLLSVPLCTAPPPLLPAAALQLAGGVMDDMVMQVGMQHGMPSYIASADACVGSSDTAEQVRCSREGPC